MLAATKIKGFDSDDAVGKENVPAPMSLVMLFRILISINLVFLLNLQTLTALNDR